MTKLNYFSKTSLLLTALVGITLGACDPKMIGEETAGDSECKNGETKKAEDNCNDCTCVDGGWACTEKACDDTGPAPTCEEGETKPAGDGCNTCQCFEGDWACTMTACEPDVCKPGETKQEDCNTCNCVDGGWACTELYCGGACGDGLVDGAEKCDDGNQVDDDACPNDCGLGGTTGETGGETDSTTGDTGDTGTDTGVAGVCGDGILGAGEQCDDGNAVDDDGCTTVCTLSDGICGPSDPLTIDDAVIVGDSLNVTVGYGGGCETHVIDLCWNETFLESFPVQTMVSLSHDGNDDLCDAFITELRMIDLGGMKKAYQDGYQTQTGTIMIHLQGWNTTLEYTF